MEQDERMSRSFPEPSTVALRPLYCLAGWVTCRGLMKAGNSDEHAGFNERLCSFVDDQKDELLTKLIGVTVSTK